MYHGLNLPCVCFHIQVSSLLRAKDSFCDLAAVPLHQRSKSYLQEVSASFAVLQRKGTFIRPSTCNAGHAALYSAQLCSKM